MKEPIGQIKSLHDGEKRICDDRDVDSIIDEQGDKNGGRGSGRRRKRDSGEE